MRKLFFIIFIFLLTTASYAQKGGTIDINSNRMEVDLGKNIITFYDDVVAKRDDLTLYASLLKVHYKELTPDKKKDVDYIIAEGNVRIVQGVRIATGDEARFYKDKDIIVLTGKPATVKEDNNQISGSKVTIYIKENKSVVEGDRPRVIFKIGE